MHWMGDPEQTPPPHFKATSFMPCATRSYLSIVELVVHRCLCDQSNSATPIDAVPAACPIQWNALSVIKKL